MSLPWAKFFWSDYASDPALKLCSFAAQGLWMRMLCIAAEHDPVGYVAVNGRGLDVTGIARITGGAADEVRELLDELKENSVYSTDRRGWIYSRRLITDAKKRAKASEAGKKGGNPSLRKDEENSDTLKGQDKGEDNQPPKPQKPEARSSEDKSSGGEPPPDPLKELFDLGVSILTTNGKTEKEARSLIGKWRKDKGDAPVLQGLLDCRAKAISEPVEWLQARFNGAKWVSASGYEYRGSDRDVLREAEKRNDMSTYWAVKIKLDEKPRLPPKPRDRRSGVSAIGDLIPRSAGGSSGKA